MSEGEVRALCEKSREIFLSQERAQFSAENWQSIDVVLQTWRVIKCDKSATWPDQPQLISCRGDKKRETVIFCDSYSSAFHRVIFNHWLVRILADFIAGQKRLEKEGNSCSLFTNLDARGSTRKSIFFSVCFAISLQIYTVVFFWGQFYVILCNLWCLFVCACLKCSFWKLFLIFDSLPQFFWNQQGQQKKIELDISQFFLN